MILLSALNTVPKAMCVCCPGWKMCTYGMANWPRLQRGVSRQLFHVLKQFRGKVPKLLSTPSFWTFHAHFSPFEGSGAGDVFVF